MVRHIRMGLKDTGFDGFNWINVAQNNRHSPRFAECIDQIYKFIGSLFSVSYSDLRSFAIFLSLSRLKIHKRTAKRIVYISVY
jgi:hypothetical protein